MAVRRGTQSAITSVISTTLICPKAKFDLIGSSQIAAAATISVVSNHRRSQAGRAPPVRCSTRRAG